MAAEHVSSDPLLPVVMALLLPTKLLLDLMEIWSRPMPSSMETTCAEREKVKQNFKKKSSFLATKFRINFVVYKQYLPAPP